MAANEEMLSARSQPSDIISNVPENIIESILVCLPTRDAIKTSVLSKTWRYRWAKLPRLILDEMFWYKSIVKRSDMSIVAAILNHIMLLHEGPIKKFTLSLPGLQGCPEIDNLVSFLSTNGIEAFKLFMATDQEYILPLSFFTCQQLRHLSLKACVIDTPSAFMGFRRLTTLELRSVTIMGKLLESLISSCPLLKVLKLVDTPLSDDPPVEIDAPNIEIFRYLGNEIMFIFKNVPRLSHVSYRPFDLSLYGERPTYNLAKFFNDLPAIKRLSLSRTVVKYLVAGEVPSRLPITLIHLQELKLDAIVLERFNELLFIICLLRSSPNMTTMKITFCLDGDSDANAHLELLKEQSCSDLLLNRLEIVEMEVVGTMIEVELIKLLLAKSPNLKHMHIEFYEPEEDTVYEVFKELANFPCASTQAQVIFVEQENQV